MLPPGICRFRCHWSVPSGVTEPDVGKVHPGMRGCQCGWRNISKTGCRFLKTVAGMRAGAGGRVGEGEAPTEGDAPYGRTEGRKNGAGMAGRTRSTFNIQVGWCQCCGQGSRSVPAPARDRGRSRYSSQMPAPITCASAPPSRQHGRRTRPCLQLFLSLAFCLLSSALNVKQEVAHVAVVHDVGFAFDA